MRAAGGSSPRGRDLVESWEDANAGEADVASRTVFVGRGLTLRDGCRAEEGELTAKLVVVVVVVVVGEGGVGRSRR